MINNVQHAFLLTLPSRFLRICCREKVTKVSAIRKCLQGKKHVPIGGKWHHTSQNYMAKHVMWLLGNRGKLWEGLTVTVIASFES